MPEKITIKKIGRQDMPSKFKPGETYTLTKIIDDKNRKLSTFGKWAENWKIGETVEGIVKEKKWTDKDGFEQISLNIDNPNKSTFQRKSENSFNPKASAYNSAVMFILALAVSGTKKEIRLEDVDKVAEHFITKFNSSQETKNEEVPKVDVEKEEKTTENIGTIEEEDDGDIF